MYKLLISLISLTFTTLLGVLGAPSICNNPLLSTFGFDSFSSPQASSNLLYCKSLNNSQSCCSETIINNFQVQANDLKARLTKIVIARDQFLINKRNKVLGRLQGSLSRLKDASEKAMAVILANSSSNSTASNATNSTGGSGNSTNSTKPGGNNGTQNANNTNTTNSGGNNSTNSTKPGGNNSTNSTQPGGNNSTQNTNNTNTNTTNSGGNNSTNSTKPGSNNSTQNGTNQTSSNNNSTNSTSSGGNKRMLAANNTNANQTNVTNSTQNSTNSTSNTNTTNPGWNNSTTNNTNTTNPGVNNSTNSTKPGGNNSTNSTQPGGNNSTPNNTNQAGSNNGTNTTTGNNTTKFDQATIDIIQRFGDLGRQMTDQLTQLKGNFTNYQKTRAKCIVELMNIQTSAWCLACDPNWGNKGVLADGSIQLSKFLCKRLTKACYDFISHSDEQNNILTVYYISSMFDSLAAAMDLITLGDPSGPSALTSAFSDVSVSSSGPRNNAQLPASKPENCTAEKCDFICSSFFVKGLIDEDTLAAGGELASSSSSDSTKRVLEEVFEEGKAVKTLLKNRKLQGTEGWNPDSNESGISLTFEEDPAKVNFSSNLVYNGIVCIGALLIALLI